MAPVYPVKHIFYCCNKLTPVISIPYASNTFASDLEVSLRLPTLWLPPSPALFHSPTPSLSLSLTLFPSPSLSLLCRRLMMPLLRDVRCQVATASNCSIWLLFCLFFMNCGILVVMTAASSSRSPTAAVSAALSATATATPSCICTACRRTSFSG